MPTPPAAITPPTIAPSARDPEQERVHSTSVMPYPITAPKIPATTTLAKASKNAIRVGIVGGASRPTGSSMC